MMNNKIKCAVFDLDGTLLNTIKTINYYLNFALSEYGLASVSEQDTMSFVGDGAVKLIERALKSVGGDVSLFDDVYKTYNEAYNSSPYYLTEPYDGIKETLMALKEQGINLSVLSNKPDFATKATVSHFFGDVFDCVLGGRDGVPLKPCPDALFDIMREMGVTPDETVYIGDSEPDVLTAKNAGIEKGIFVTWGFRTEGELKNAGAKNLINEPVQILDKI
jgi:phosphoglycolate phosphatase